MNQIFIGILTVISTVSVASGVLEQSYKNSLLDPKPVKYMEFLPPSSLDEEKYAQISGYSAIQSQFLDDIFSSRDQRPEILDVCAGKGSTFKTVVSDSRSSLQSVGYTVVETQKVHVDAIKGIYEAYKEKATINLGVAHKSFFDYYETKFESKINKFDIVFGGFALHIFGPREYVTSLDKIYMMMKPGAKLYMTQHSYRGDFYSPEYIEALDQDEILPFWVDGVFSSDTRTMNQLVRAFGFNVIKSEISIQRHGSPFSKDNTVTKYLSMILEKPLVENRMEKEIQRYHGRAHDLEQKYKEQ